MEYHARSQIPSSKLQAPEKHQNPNPKSGDRLGASAGCGFFAASLRLGAWSFSRAWSLVLGVYSRADSHAVKPRPRSDGVGVHVGRRAGLANDVALHRREGRLRPQVGSTFDKVVA